MFTEIKPKDITEVDLIKNVKYYLWFMPSMSITYRLKGLRLLCMVSHVKNSTIIWCGKPKMLIIGYSGYLSKSQLMETKGWDSTSRMSMVNSLQPYQRRKFQDQTNLLYSWEENTLKSPIINKKESLKLIKEILHPYGISAKTTHKKLPDKTYRSVARVTKYCGTFSHAKQYEIICNSELPTTMHDVIHETSHLIDYYLYRSMSHGPSFTGIYAQYLKDYGICSQADTKMKNNGLALLNKREIKWEK